MIKISVITVSYNAERTIEKAIKSIIHQKTDEIEYIVIDGGSTDGTVDIIKEYDEFITFWTSKPDNGIYDAMNKGIDRATGKYINFLNSDDWFEENVLDKVLKVIDRVDADVFYGDVIREDGRFGTKWIPETLERVYWWMPFGHQGSFVRRTDDLKFDVTYRIAADYKMMLELYASGKKFFYLPFTIAHFGQDGISNTNNYLMCTEQVTISSKKMIDDPNPRIVYKDRIVDVYVRAEAMHQIDIVGKAGVFKEYMDGVSGFRKSVICFGCGKIALGMLNCLKVLGVDIKFLVDNDREKHGLVWNDYKIMPVESLKTEENVTIFVTMERNTDDVKRQIKGMFLSKSVDVLYYCDLINDFIMKYKDVLIAIGRKRISAFDVLCDME